MRIINPPDQLLNTQPDAKPVEVDESVYQEMRARLAAQHPDMDDEELENHLAYVLCLHPQTGAANPNIAPVAQMVDAGDSTTRAVNGILQDSLHTKSVLRALYLDSARASDEQAGKIQTSVDLVCEAVRSIPDPTGPIGQSAERVAGEVKSGIERLSAEIVAVKDAASARVLRDDQKSEAQIAAIASVGNVAAAELGKLHALCVGLFPQFAELHRRSMEQTAGLGAARSAEFMELLGAVQLHSTDRANDAVMVIAALQTLVSLLVTNEAQAANRAAAGNSAFSSGLVGVVNTVRESVKGAVRAVEALHEIQQSNGLAAGIAAASAKARYQAAYRMAAVFGSAITIELAILIWRAI